MNILDDIIAAYVPKPDDLSYIVYQNAKLLQENRLLQKQLRNHKNIINNGIMGVSILIYGGIFYYFL